MELIPLSKISKAKIDTARHGTETTGYRRNMPVLLQAAQCWDNMERFRRDRERNKNYNYGRQWDDIIEVDGKAMTEAEYIQKEGNVPLKNNLIRRFVRNVVGLYRSGGQEPVCTARDREEQTLGETMTTVLQYNHQLNRMSEMNARSMEEFLISGLVIHKKTFGWRDGRIDEWTDYVNPCNFFVDGAMRDFRGWDCTMIGEIHDISFGELCQTFAKNRRQYDFLSKEYSLSKDRQFLTDNCEQFGHRRLSNIDFFLPHDLTLCRVIEVWTKEQKERYRCHDYLTGDNFKCDSEDYKTLVDDINRQRLAQGKEQGMTRDDIPLIFAEYFIDSYWYVRYFTPTGTIIAEEETPYAHGSHPYVFKAYPFIDGEIHSFVSDVIDQQRYVNRLITMYDFIMRASAKGALLVPEGAKPDNMTWQEFADTWARFNGIIVYKAKAGVPVPQQVSANSVNIGIADMLSMQLKFLEDISGVHGALQGATASAGTSGTLYAQQTQNATTSLLDIIDAYHSFEIDGAYKDVQNIQQFYDDKRVFNIAGAGHLTEYDPRKIQNVEFDLSIQTSQITPAYRQAANEFLMQLFQAGAINLQQLLEAGQFPFGDQLLQSVQAQQQQMAQGQTPEALPQELQNQVNGGANPQAAALLQQATGNNQQ